MPLGLNGAILLLCYSVVFLIVLLPFSPKALQSVNKYTGNSDCLYWLPIKTLVSRGPILGLWQETPTCNNSLC